MATQAADFLLASGKLQTLLYKEEIESALRTPGMGGFQLLDLHDFPGQGTALVGVLDPFWDSKGYVTPEEYRRFCAETVPLARLDQRVFTTAETLAADIEVAHFGAGARSRRAPPWRLVDDDGRAVARGTLPRARRIPIGNGTRPGRRRASPLAAARGARARYRLVVGARRARRSRTTGTSGSIRATRRTAPCPPDVLVVARAGRRGAEARSARRRPRACSSSRPAASAATRSAASSSASRASSGTPRGPAARPRTRWASCATPSTRRSRAFPTEFHSNWQWWYLVSRAGAMILDDLPAGLRPDRAGDRRLVHEPQARPRVRGAGGRAGRLLVTQHRPRPDDLATNPVARQMRRSLLAYAASDEFHPSVEVSAEAIRGLFDR